MGKTPSLAALPVSATTLPPTVLNHGIDPASAHGAVLVVFALVYLGMFLGGLPRRALLAALIAVTCAANTTRAPSVSLETRHHEPAVDPWQRAKGLALAMVWGWMAW